MKFITPALALFAAVCIAFGSSGCGLFHHHEPKSSWKIINEGDDNPYIVDAPTRAGTVVRNVDAGSDTRKQSPQQQQQQELRQQQEYQQYLQYQQMQQQQQPQQQQQTQTPPQQPPQQPQVLQPSQ